MQARAGTRTAYWFGDNPAELPEHGNFADRNLRESDFVGEYPKDWLENAGGSGYFTYAHKTWSDGHARMTPVGTFPANPWVSTTSAATSPSSPRRPTTPGARRRRSSTTSPAGFVEGELVEHAGLLPLRLPRALQLPVAGERHAELSRAAAGVEEEGQMRTLATAIAFGLAAASPAGAGEAMFALLDKYCLDCHDDETKKGEVSLEGIAGFGDGPPDLWSSIREKVQLREMPPEKKPQPGAEERAELSAWIAAELRAAGHHVSDKLDWPNYGNYVDHEALFSGEPHPAPATRVRLWRKRPEAYSHKSGGGIQPFSMLPGQQISDYSAVYLVDESAAEIVLRNAQKLIERSTQFELKGGRWVKVEGTRSEGVYAPLLVEGTEPSEEDFAKAVGWQFGRAVGRLPTDDEVARLRGLYDAVLAEHGRLHALRAVMTAPLLMPESLYRLELGAGEADGHGRRRLSKAEILAAPAPHPVRQAPAPGAARGEGKSELATRDGVADLVRQLLDGDRPNERVLNFFDEYFEYEKAREVFKEPPRGLAYNAPQFVADCRKLIAGIVAEDRDVFRRLLTTTQTYIAPDSDPPGNERIYGLPGDWKWREGPRSTCRPTSGRGSSPTRPGWSRSRETSTTTP